MSPHQRHRLAVLALILLIAGGCTPLASTSAGPLAGATVPPLASTTVLPPVRLQFVAENGTNVTIAIDDQSGLLGEATEGEPFSTEDPGAKDLVYEGNYVVFLNDGSDDSVLRVEWAAGGGCAASYAMTIDPTARKLRIEGPPAGSDSIGGNCDVTLRFSDSVRAAEVEGVLPDQG